jgi:2-keto-4-pentenoate hydratase/2-oxohepta-3-ene-1,7-dioic acid hydratase in catechol pathway
MLVGLGPSKGKDFATTLGPWITTPDELEKYRDGDRYDLPMSVSVNGVEMGSYNLKYMSWSFEELISHSSRGSYVGAGDVLASGTAHGGSLAEKWAAAKSRENPAPLKPGDVVSMTVEGLGTIWNPIVPTVSPGHTVPRARSIHEDGH